MSGLPPRTNIEFRDCTQTLFNEQEQPWVQDLSLYEIKNCKVNKDLRQDFNYLSNSKVQKSPEIKKSAKIKSIKPLFQSIK